MKTFARREPLVACLLPLVLLVATACDDSPNSENTNGPDVTASAAAAPGTPPGAAATGPTPTGTPPTADAAAPAPHTTGFVYPRGCYAGWGANDGPVTPALLNNPGLVGIAITIDWSELETTEGTYAFSGMDARVTEIENAGKKVIIGVTASAAKAPAWMFANPNVEKVAIVDPNPNHGGGGTIQIIPFWDPIFHAKKKAMIKAVGARFAADPNVVGAMEGFANYYTNDWGIPTDLKSHGYTYAGMLQVGKEILQTAADAFPNQAIKLPISQNDKTMDPGKTTTQMADDIIAWALQSSFADRFFAQKNLVNTNSPYASDPLFQNVNPSSNDYLFKVLRDMSPAMGLQMVASATGGPQDGCRQNAHQTPCDDVSTVMSKSIDISLSYKPTFLEFWTADAKNTALYPQFVSATAAMKAQP